MLIEPNVAKVPTAMINKVKDAVGQLKVFHNEATEKLRLKGPVDFTCESDEVGPIVRDAAVTMKLMTSMLVAIGSL